MGQDMLRAILMEIEDSGENVVHLLEKYAEHRLPHLWKADTRLYKAFARELVSAGYPNRGFEIVQEGLHRHEDPPDLELAYLRAFALARGGNTRKADEFLAPLLKDRKAPPALRADLFSLAGRLEKDLYQRARSARRKKALARASAQFYEAASRYTDESYPVINAATMYLCAGQGNKATQLAGEAERRARNERRRKSREGDYWILATLGEANLLQSKFRQAARWYSKAVQAAAGRVGDLSSMRRNVELVGSALGVNLDFLDLFHFGRVLVFSGHMLDHPNRIRKHGQALRFPQDPNLENALRQAIRKNLDALDATIGYTSAACGSDLLFAEEMLNRGAELHVILPFHQEDFVATSVDFGLDAMHPWRLRFDEVMRQCTTVHYATREHYLGDDTLFLFTNRFIVGMAMLRAKHLGLKPHGLAVVDAQSTKLAEGVLAFLDEWQALGVKTSQVNLAALRDRHHCTNAVGKPVPQRSKPRKPASTPPTVLEHRRSIKAMLFADVKNFSKLHEEQTPQFTLAFLQKVGEVIEESEPKPVYRNTWGDGLYLVFNDVPACADFAMRLIERIEETAFEEMGLPADLTVRIGIHTGPVYHMKNPILGKYGFVGSHVARAARIEPVTTPGCAFASEQFAAILSAHQEHGFTCEYVGVESLAKGYDRCPLYQVLRS